jgi:hypothetical protein
MFIIISNLSPVITVPAYDHPLTSPLPAQHTPPILFLT